MTPTLTATAVCPMPEPLIAAPDDGGDQAYFALAAKLKIRNAFIVRREMETVLQEEGIHVYDIEKVRAWMTSLVNKENARLLAEWKDTATPEQIKDYSRDPLGLKSWLGFASRPKRVIWGWRPLRGSDVKGLTHEHPLSGTYLHAIPFAVLTTIERLQGRLPHAKFFVSDYETELPDPFLMITHPTLGLNGFVVERWNEPGFRG